MPLYDANGLPVSSTQFRYLDAAQENGSRPPMVTKSEGIRRAINTLDWRTVVSVSRNLYANMGVPRGAIRQKADFAVGDAWQPVHCGAKDAKTKEWAKIAVEWLLGQFYPMCEVRGGAFDFVSTLNVDSISIDRDGGFGILLTESADGFPQTQRIPIHRFGARWDMQESIVEKGDFKGMRIHQGIIYSPAGRPIGGRIYEDPVNYTTPAAYEDISESNLIHVYEPDFYDMGHGMPAFIHALNDLRDCKQSKEWEQHAMLLASQIGLVEKNEAGSIDTSDLSYVNAQPDSTLPAVHTEIFDSGGVQVRYMKANSGAGLDQFVSSKPGEDWERFNDRLIRGALVGIGWPSSFLWKADGTGVDSREDILQCRQAVSKRQRVLKPAAKRIIGYAVSKAIKRKDIPPYPGDDLGGMLRWDFQMPARMTVDDGREAKQRLENLKMGVTTEDDIAAENGRTGEQVRDRREYELDDLLTRAKRVADKHGIPLMDAAQWLQQRSPNPVAQVPQASTPPVDNPSEA